MNSLAPDLVARQERGEITLFLLVGSELDDRRPDHIDTDLEEPPGDPERVLLFGEDRSQVSGHTLAAVVRRPVKPRPTFTGFERLPRLGPGDDRIIIGGCSRSIRSHQIGAVGGDGAGICGQPFVGALPESSLFWSVIEVHRHRFYRDRRFRSLTGGNHICRCRFIVVANVHQMPLIVVSRTNQIRFSC